MQTTVTYKQALKLARKLNRTERLRLIQALAARSGARTNHKKHSILELRGLGKQIWEGIDAQEYVRRERASWIG